MLTKLREYKEKIQLLRQVPQEWLHQNDSSIRLALATHSSPIQNFTDNTFVQPSYVK